jgi:hypothetical protein
MNLTRRGFLGACLVLGIAPAVVQARSLMPVRVLDKSYDLIIPAGALFPESSALLYEWSVPPDCYLHFNTLRHQHFITKAEWSDGTPIAVSQNGSHAVLYNPHWEIRTARIYAK